VQHTITPGRRHVPVPLSPSRTALTTPVRSRSSSAGSDRVARALRNPILPAPAQDPQITWIDGRYYYCESSEHGIFLRSSEDFVDLAQAPRVRVWLPPQAGPCSRNIWAPELHLIDGRCYIYFAADDGNNANHRMWVLESEEGKPSGRFNLVGQMETAGWAIDGTTFVGPDHKRYFVWSGWPGRTDGQQYLYISRMSSPTRLEGQRVVIGKPTQSWERRGMPICEGPQILRRGGRTCLVYSASASWTADYCLGLMVHDGGDLMNPSNWRKEGQVFGRNQHAWGVGHCGFLTTPEGEDWIFYHAKTKFRPGWTDREVRAQPYSWDHDGLPFFGEPVAVSYVAGR
jgi:GH43 family beta-xylosidase